MSLTWNSTRSGVSRPIHQQGYELSLEQIPSTLSRLQLSTGAKLETKPQTKLMTKLPAVRPLNVSMYKEKSHLMKV